jgi:predicted nucleic acid-binding protein
VIVVDASVLAAALGDDGSDGDLARRRLSADPNLHAPHLVDLEVLSVWRRRAVVGDLGERRSSLALQDLADLPIVRYPHLPFAARVWELRHNVTPYDAAYIALAETLECPFVTADAKVAAAGGIKCTVEVLR